MTRVCSHRHRKECIFSDHVLNDVLLVNQRHERNNFLTEFLYYSNQYIETNKLQYRRVAPRSLLVCARCKNRLN